MNFTLANLTKKNPKWPKNIANKPFENTNKLVSLHTVYLKTQISDIHSKQYI